MNIFCKFNIEVRRKTYKQWTKEEINPPKEYIYHFNKKTHDKQTY